MQKKNIVLIFLLLQINFLLAQKQNEKPAQDKRDKGFFQTEIPNHLYDIILGRPTNSSISVSIYTTEEFSGEIHYGKSENKLNFKTPKTEFKKNNCSVIELKNLEPNQKYFYQLVYQQNNKQETSSLNYFFTQRAEKNKFTFCVQADSHLDENTKPEMYLQTLQNMSDDSPDFLIDLGDTWMTDKYRNDYKESHKQYIAQRYYFGTLCKSSSLFLTLGNHDGESGRSARKKEEENMTAWATATRKSLYINPEPNEFYSGNSEKEISSSEPENYYSWQWGDALFIVLDPFRYCDANKDPWQRSLGEKQYFWLKKTLESSKAKFKFVFIHNLVGGVDKKGKGRGGSEAATFFEWGGMDTSGINMFRQNRPGWEKPIHDLLSDNNVNIVFHGHDHFFAKQDLGKLVYQLVPQPGSMKYDNTNAGKEYGYKDGALMNTPGYMKITIDNNKSEVEYIQTSIDNNHENKKVLYTYTIKPLK